MIIAEGTMAVIVIAIAVLLANVHTFGGLQWLGRAPTSSPTQTPVLSPTSSYGPTAIYLCDKGKLKNNWFAAVNSKTSTCATGQNLGVTVQGGTSLGFEGEDGGFEPASSFSITINDCKAQSVQSGPGFPPTNECFVFKVARPNEKGDNGDVEFDLYPDGSYFAHYVKAGEYFDATYTKIPHWNNSISHTLTIAMTPTSFAIYMDHKQVSTTVVTVVYDASQTGGVTATPTPQGAATFNPTSLPTNVDIVVPQGSSVTLSAFTVAPTKS